MKKNQLIILLAISVIVIGISFFVQDSGSTKKNSLSLTEVLSNDDNNFSQALTPREFDFPRDHGAHPAYKTEWWYVTGNVEADNGHDFGYQVTFFRIGLTATKVKTDSAWASNQFYMAHVAVSDISGQQFFSRERFARAALGLAGVETEPKIKVWLEDWVLSGQEKDLFPLTIDIKDTDFALSLNMQSQKPLVKQGDRGLSQKGPESGNASYYYSYTRLATTGKIQIKNSQVKDSQLKDYQVKGYSWLDREWSTSMLPKGVEGWDWFSIQLENNIELMFYRLRTTTGKATNFSRGSLVLTSGNKVDLNAEQVQVTPEDWWQSEKSDIRYPINWSIKIPSLELELNVKAAIENQELNHSVRYWEGAIKVTGRYQQQIVKGKGYLEMAGYAR